MGFYNVTAYIMIFIMKRSYVTWPYIYNVIITSNKTIFFLIYCNLWLVALYKNCQYVCLQGPVVWPLLFWIYLTKICDESTQVLPVIICMYIAIILFDLIWKTNQIVTIGISRNTNFKYWSHHGSFAIDFSHARSTV